MKKNFTLLSMAFLAATSLSAQNVVKGRVVDAEGQPVIGASIKAGSKVVAVTGNDGTFSIAKIPTGTKSITVAYIGMKPETVSIAGNVQVVLHEDNANLDETIVVAYGTAKKTSFTGSAAVIKADQIEKRQVSNLTKAFQGEIAGVQTISANGQPGVSATVQIRGFGSLNAGTDPLYVVDGVPYSGDISSINTQDIESYSVLKDAAATALYGARGANGVIMITTKKGKTGEARITVDARWGVNSRGVKNQKVLSSPAAYMEKLYEAKYNEGIFNLSKSEADARTYANEEVLSSVGSPVYTLPTGEQLIGADGKINPNAKLGAYVNGNYFLADDWAKETFTNGFRQEYNIGISGGNDRLSYYIGGGYLEDNGIIDKSDLRRFTTRTNIDYQAREWLKVGANMAYTNKDSQIPDEQTTSGSSGNAFYVANYIAPIYAMYLRNADGSLVRDAYTGLPVYDYGDGFGYTRNYISLANPAGDLQYNTRRYLTDQFTGKWYAAITPLRGLTITASVGTTILSENFHSSESGLYGQSKSGGGQSIQQNKRSFSLNKQLLATYKTSLGSNNLDFLLGYEDYTSSAEYVSAQGNNLYNPSSWVVSNTIDKKDGFGDYNSYSTRGVIFRTNYDWQEKYFASFSLREDASSRFHPDHRWGTFWSISGAWDIAKENFIRPYQWINLLKLKASYGQQGNDRIGNDYAYTDQYRVTGANGFFSDAQLYYKGNKDLTWEKSNAFNVGLDFAVINNRFTGTVEFFSRTTTDMLYNKPVANSNGYSKMPVNVGSMRNSGLELDLHYAIFKQDNFKWNVGLNATFLKNKILSLSPDLNGELLDKNNLYKEGESMYQFSLVSYAGVDPKTGEALYYALEDDASNPGQKKEITTADWNAAFNTNRKATGDLLPTVSGGLSTSIEFANFDFSISAAYQLGGKVLDHGYRSFMHGASTNNIGMNWHEDIARAWTPTNTVTDVPRVNSSDKYTNSMSDRWLTSSNYLSINNITLGYTLPAHLSKRIYMNRLRCYVAADNLAVFSVRQGFDPRQDFRDAAPYFYTAMRTISLGVKLDF